MEDVKEIMKLKDWTIFLDFFSFTENDLEKNTRVWLLNTSTARSHSQLA